MSVAGKLQHKLFSWLRRGEGERGVASLSTLKCANLDCKLSFEKVVKNFPVNFEEEEN
jgi:hypothetical protein